MTGAVDWPDLYRAVVDRRADWVAGAGPIVAGFSATTDALHRMTPERLGRLLGAEHAGSEAFGDCVRTIRQWVKEGRDGELFIDDEAAEPVLEDVVGRPERVQCGGTSIQASWSWSALGLRPLLALTNRTARQLAATADGVRVVEGAEIVPIRSVEATGGRPVPSNHVLELTAGTSADGVTVQRSSRITVVLRRKRLQLDGGFLARSADHVRGGVGLVSGLNGLGREREQALPVVAGALAGWREAGARMVHLELAEYARTGELGRVMELVGDQVDSVGMNASELGRLVAIGDPATAAADFALGHRLGRVVVHADHWAMSVHRGDPVREAAALAAGSLAAANRAEQGEPRGVWRVPTGAAFATEVPPSGPTMSGYRATVVATPYLASPRSTIGLGDTFVSGDLLVQSNPSVAM